ncbi:MAG: aspartyl protease family protein [Polyangiaceae bacterium]
MRLASLTKSLPAFFALISLAASGCGGAPSPRAATKTPEVPQKQPDPPKAVGCTDHVDVADLFARHAKKYGSEADVLQALPVTMSGTVTVSGKVGKYDMSIDAKRSRTSIHLKGFERAMGVDESGAWQLGNSGAVARLRPNEVRATDEWMMGRHYLSAFDQKRDGSRCQLDGAKRQIIVHERLPELGEPRLVFDQDSAELVGAEFRGADGTMSTRTMTWSARAGNAPSWPSHAAQQSGEGSTIEFSSEQIVASSADAFALPASLLEITWPKSGRVRVPMKLYGGEILIDVTIAGRKARALLDSGAGISIVEAGGNAADAFQSELEFDGQSATQKIRFGIGTLAETKVGGLTVKNIPAARVPIPMLDQFGPNRPDVVLGWSLFEGQAVRIDYAKNELVFARDASALHAGAAPSIDFQDLDDKVIAIAKLGVKDALFQLDTGNAAGVSLYSSWAKKNGVPAEGTPTATVKGQFSAGTDVTSNSFYRSAIALGPVSAPNDFVEVSEGPGNGAIAGLIGNMVFAKCGAVVFDVPNRKLWFDGACNRNPLQSHTWWTLARKDDASNAKAPWVVVSTAAKGSADVAGVLSGDRIVAIDEKPVGPTFDFIATFTKPLGTKVVVTVLRGSETKKFPMTFVDPF